MTKIIIDLDYTNLRFIRSDDDFENLLKETKHKIWTNRPIEYPALYSCRWWNNPNGPEDYLWEEIASGDCIDTIENFMKKVCE